MGSIRNVEKIVVGCKRGIQCGLLSSAEGREDRSDAYGKFYYAFRVSWIQSSRRSRTKAGMAQPRDRVAGARKRFSIPLQPMHAGGVRGDGVPKAVDPALVFMATRHVLAFSTVPGHLSALRAQGGILALAGAL